MPCQDLHVNVQDAAMDRIMAGDLLTKEPTNFELWLDSKKMFRLKKTQGQGGMYNSLYEANTARQRAEEEDSHVGHVLGHMRDNPSKKFEHTPRLPKGTPENACRIYGSLEGNKVQGDFHITARGHGYMEFGMQQHLDHGTFNFSHHINELSFGPHYPSLLNPLDKTSDTTSQHFMRYQYYLSIVPTIFTKRRISTRSGSLDPAAIPQPPTLDLQPNTIRDKDGIIRHIPHPDSNRDSKSIFTNQYAAQSQSREVPTNTVPGVFFKYDIEPILLIVSESRSGFLSLMVRLVNVISGVIVGGGWMFQISEWAGEIWGRRKMRRSTTGLGMLDRGFGMNGHGEKGS
jgi:endoplasmic reticulum-Golgi intermediate compartment protein 2